MTLLEGVRDGHLELSGAVHSKVLAISPATVDRILAPIRQCRRRYIGYDRYEGGEPCRFINALYERLRLYVNFFQPSLKLVKKIRNGTRVSKFYDEAKTPYQRVLASELVVDDGKAMVSLSNSIRFGCCGKLNSYRMRSGVMPTSPPAWW
jgi:hypothetical protein